MSIQNLISLFGLFAMLFVAYMLSNNRKRVDFRVVMWGTVLQFVFALVVFKFPLGKQFFLWLNDVVTALLDFTNEGSAFVFGQGFREHFFAFSVLPTIIFFSSLMAIAYHLGVMQKVVLIFAKIMNKIMGTSGAESLSASANIFVGQTEAPLVIRPYVEKMTMSELMAVMTGGMATVAGGVMGAYVGFLRDSFPNIAGHLITASILSAPAALVIAKLMVPEVEEPLTRGEVKTDLPKEDTNVIEAAAKGAGDGMGLALNVGAMLLAFVALIAMINFCFTWVGDQFNYFVRGIDSYSVISKDLASRVKGGDEFINSYSLDMTGVTVIKVGKKVVRRNFSFSSPIKSVDKNSGKITLEKRLPNEIRLGTKVTLKKEGKVVAFTGSCVGKPGFKLSLQSILGIIFFPFAFIMGVPLADCTVISKLFGEKLILTEFLAYVHLAADLKDGLISDPRSVVIATYALCGFANFASIAIQIGGIAGIAPSRRGDLARLGVKSVIGGTLAAFMTATVAGIFYTGETVLLDKNQLNKGVSQKSEQVRVIGSAPSESAFSKVVSLAGIDY